MSVRIYPKHGICGDYVTYRMNQNTENVERLLINVNLDHLLVGDSQETDRVVIYIDSDDADDDQGGLTCTLTCDDAELFAHALMQQVKKYRPTN